MRHCGCMDVPSFAALRKTQTCLSKEVGVPTRLHHGNTGTVFFMNDLPTLLAMDYANPQVRPHLHFYPEARAVQISEAWQARKWVKEIEWDKLTPMVSVHGKHFYVGEMAETSKGDLVIPLRWVKRDGILCGDSLRVIYYEATGRSVIQENQLVAVPVEELKFNYLHLQEEDVVIHLAGSKQWKEAMPNPLREIAKGRPMYTSFVKAWGDDVSGNMTKQYNPHLNIYVQHSNLPHRLLSQEYFVRFLSTSPSASSAEQFAGLVNQITQVNLFLPWDCLHNEEICFRVLVHSLPADNPQQSESGSHIGLHANHFCRACHAGGTHQQKESLEGYHALFSPGVPRTAKETLIMIEEQLFLAGLGVATSVEEHQRESGVKDSTAQRWIELILRRAVEIQKQHIFHPETRDPRLSNRKIKGEVRKQIVEEIKLEIQYELRKWLLTQPPEEYAKHLLNSSARKNILSGIHYNALLAQEELDVNRDTPVEILHTYLLGNTKYVWHSTNTTWDVPQCQIFALRLQSTSTLGLGIPPIAGKYMLQYRNNLIGRHFKSLQQVAIFHLQADLCSPLFLELWKVTGELGALLWYHSIENMDEYLADLRILIDNLLDIWCLIDPSKITVKPKLHILIFEAYNGVFRMCSILSNHQAPSRDIAISLSDMEQIKHIVSGGYWQHENGTWLCAGSLVRQMWNDNPIIHRHLGWADSIPPSPGYVKLKARKKRNPRAWLETSAHVCQPSPLSDPNILWSDCISVIARSGDVCQVGSWVFFEHMVGTAAGRIEEIISSLNGLVFITLTGFDVSDTRDSRHNMPTLRRKNGDHRLMTIIPKDILFDFNVQHNCVLGGCGPTGEHRQRQERMESNIIENFIVHTDDDNFVINMHAIHNAALTRKVLPRNLTQPMPYSTEREELHALQASKLRVVQAEKRAVTAAKTAATRAKKAAGSIAKQGGGEVGEIIS
ncbi:hypothetical protein M422DRAFT_61644 [Sphaerobolus stellatus SS14]|uniref:Uncharacterized protein n=1 Tax=Sphaerobolus stellatus (strain SS14) TaxID=990650 RepID=A0A0C9UQY6_SPHS4|nr:hypothetical protein M422DRAFT_61644 [Sphaerobolus stellatus SS14]